MNGPVVPYSRHPPKGKSGVTRRWQTHQQRSAAPEATLATPTKEQARDNGDENHADNADKHIALSGCGQACLTTDSGRSPPSTMRGCSTLRRCGAVLGACRERSQTLIVLSLCTNVLIQITSPSRINGNSS